jgi:hypothetical protein
MKRKRKYKRVDWDDPQNILPLHVVVKEFAFDGPTLASMTGLTLGQVYYRLRHLGVSLRDTRKGLVGYGADVKKRFTISNPKIKLSVPQMRETYSEYLDIKNGVTRGRKKKQKTA